MLKFCEVSFEDNTICVDLIVLDMFDFNVIIGMNFLSEYRAHIVCQEKRVFFSLLNEHFFEFVGTKVRPLPQMFPAMQAQRCLQVGCQGFIVNVFNMNLVTQGPHHVKIISEYLDMFPEELPQMPPNREVVFTIDVIPGTTLISKAPYRMAPAELKELKERLQ